MKKNIYFLAICLASLLMYCSPSKEQTTMSTDLPVETLLKNRDFQFNANSMTTFRGRREFLTPGYRIRVSGDSLYSDLPFKGRSTQPPLNPNEAGYFFATTDFNYNLTKRSQDSWELKMEIFDNRFTRSIHLIVFDNGKTDVDVFSNFRDPVHFNGTLARIE